MRNRAEYMREYRKRQRRETIMDTTLPAQAVRELVEAQDRIRGLEEEVHHLKQELAKRPERNPEPLRTWQPGRGWTAPDRPFTPAPKPSQR